ncbi:hypothetical protein [Nonomuraea basaltis]|nr:hypothetical protein [Nonomuraea basaltis]
MTDAYPQAPGRPSHGVIAGAAATILVAAALVATPDGGFPEGPLFERTD